MLSRLKQRAVLWFVERKLKEVLTMPKLAGYRTYIIGGLYSLLVFFQASGLVPEGFQEAVTNLEKILIGAGAITMRAAIGPRS